jgi:chromosome segregation ATPase
VSRRWIPRRTEPDTAERPAAESIEQALVTAIASNRQLRVELDAAEAKLVATQAQLDFHKGALVDVKVKLGLTTDAADRLERRVDNLTHQLKQERDHTAGSCSHAAELRYVKGTLTDLEGRVRDLQRINEGYEAPGWLPRTEPVAPTRRGRR